MCTEIHVDISHFNEDTKQSSATCKNAEKPQIFSQLSAAFNRRSTEDVLNWFPSCFVTAARCLFHCKITFFYSLLIDLVPFLS